MLHPSYSELMAEINKDTPEGEKPIVNSRYSVVIAAAKRARQLIEGAESDVEDYDTKKPLSVAVEELMAGSVKILHGGDEFDMDDEKLFAVSDGYGVSMDMGDEYDEEYDSEESYDEESEEAGSVDEDQDEDDEEA